MENCRARPDSLAFANPPYNRHDWEAAEISVEHRVVECSRLPLRSQCSRYPTPNNVPICAYSWQDAYPVLSRFSARIHTVESAPIMLKRGRSATMFQRAVIHNITGITATCGSSVERARGRCGGRERH